MKYKSLLVPSYLVAEDELNLAASEGWELVTAVVVSGSLIFYLKKVK